MSQAMQHREVGRKGGAGNRSASSYGMKGDGDVDLSKLVDTLVERDGAITEFAESAKSKIEGHGERLLEVEQKLARRPGITHDESLTEAASKSAIAAALKGSESIRAFLSGEAKEARVLVTGYRSKAAIVSDGTTPSITPFSQVKPGILAPLFEAPTLESLLPHETMTTAKIEWMREKAGSDWTADVQAKQLDQKKEASVTFEPQDASASTIAVYIKAAEQALSDAAGLADYITQRLNDGVDVGTETQLLSGSGTNGQIPGFLLAGNHVALDATGLSTPTPIDLLRRARKQIRKAYGKASAVLLNPDDAEALDLVKDSQGRYILGGPTSTGSQNLWGMTPVETTAIASGTFIALDTQRSSTIYDRQELILTIGRDGNDLTTNAITIRAEVRKTMAVVRPNLIVVGTFASD